MANSFVTIVHTKSYLHIWDRPYTDVIWSPPCTAIFNLMLVWHMTVHGCRHISSAPHTRAPFFPTARFVVFDNALQGTVARVLGNNYETRTRFWSFLCTCVSCCFLIMPYRVLWQGFWTIIILSDISYGQKMVTDPFLNHHNL